MATPFAIPRELAGISNAQSLSIAEILTGTSVDLKRLARNIKREKDIQKISSELDFIVREGITEVGNEIFRGSVKGRDLSVTSDINRFKQTKLPKVAYDEFKKYVQDSQRIINLSVDQFLTKKSYVDGKTMKFRLETIEKGTSKTVEAIMRNGVREGLSPFDIGKQIEQYIKKDNRVRWTSPYTILRREQGFPVTSPYTGGVNAGSVEYNALRIARTELINNYRWARIDATKNKDWVIGWAWRLSSAHPKPDECDNWASHDEGLGEGVYADWRGIAGNGHPHCFCQVETVTIFDKNVSKYFGEAERMGLISPKKYGVAVN